MNKTKKRTRTDDLIRRFNTVDEDSLNRWAMDRSAAAAAQRYEGARRHIPLEQQRQQLHRDEETARDEEQTRKAWDDLLTSNRRELQRVRASRHAPKVQAATRGLITRRRLARDRLAVPPAEEVIKFTTPEATAVAVSSGPSVIKDEDSSSSDDEDSSSSDDEDEVSGGGSLARRHVRKKTRRKGTRRKGTRRKGTRRKGTRRKGTRRKGTRRKGTRRKGTRRKGVRRKGVRHKGVRHKGVRRKGTRRKGVRHKGVRHKGVRHRRT